MSIPRHFKIAGVLAFAACAAIGPRLCVAASSSFTTTTAPIPGSSIPPIQAAQEPNQKIEVQSVQGEVNVVQGALLHPGDIVTTGNGSCRLILDGKAELEVKPNTTLRITEALRNEKDKTTSTHLTIDSGRLKAKLAALKEGSSFVISSPTAVATVRGTTLYFAVNGQIFSQLFVDQSHGGVVFQNVKTGESFLVPNFSLSTSFADGQLDNPHELSPEEKDAFLKAWEAFKQGNPQFEVEETGGDGDADDSDDEDEDDDSETDDAAQDKQSEQNIPGSNGFAPDDEDGLSVDEEEEAMIRREIARIRNDQDFDQADANLAAISDAQTGKVFTDVHGNRVRTDQYIFHESNSDTVQFLSLTARTGAHLNGVNSILFGVQFNDDISDDTIISELPWGDYTNVVTNYEVAANLGIPEWIEGEGGPERNPDFDALAQQYVVHETAPELAQGEGALFPIHFFVEFTNSDTGRNGRDLIRFEEMYSDPFELELDTGESLEVFQVQGIETESATVQPLVGDKIVKVYSYLTDRKTISVNDGPFEDLINSGSVDESDGSQTTSFAANFVPGNLTDINYYRLLPVNSDGDPYNDDHPNYMENAFNDRLDANDNPLGSNQILGLFIPIDDQGRVIDQPGFRVEGMRDILSPNALVNGGNYNLEIILMYGYRDNEDPDRFHEDFRVDAIITPEIFTGFGAQNPNPLFPASLHPDDDDQPDF